MKILRPDQQAALDTLRDRVAEGGRRLVMQAPTGFGKTVLASSIVEGALAKKKRVLFVVPAIVLIDQTVQMFHDQGISEVGVIQATHDMTDWSQPVQVASVMTLRQRKTPEADVVVIDEVHRWFKYYEKLLTDPEWQNTPIIGMSATPWTRGLGAYFDSEPIVASTTRRLIEGGFLSPFKVFAPSHPDLKGVTTFAGDYHEGQLSERMNKRELVADIVQTWIKLALGRPTLCFAVNIEHAKNLQQQFIDAGVRAGYQDAHTKANTYTDRSGVVREGRDSIKRKFHSGELEVVVNVGTLTTGVDWDVRAIICARPTKSEILFCQMIGRGLRTAEGKDFCLILDHSDNHDRLGFVTDIDEAHANGDLNKGDTPVKNNSVIGIRLPKECKKCAYLKPPKTAVCPSCGYKDESHGKGAVVKEGDLAELKNKRKLPVVIGTKEEVYGGLLWMAKEKGYKPGWVANQYREVFEVWPYNGIEIKAPMCRPSLLLTEWVRRKQKNYRIRRGYAGSNNGNSNGALTQRQQSFIDNVAKKFAPNTLMTKDDMEVDL